MLTFAQLEAARLARDPHDRTAPVPGVDFANVNAKALKFTRQDYAVAKVYDDGREPTVLKYNLTAVDADARAGKLRDAMSESDVEQAMSEGWNYKVIFVRGNKPKTRRTWIPTVRK